ncbi:MAG TPA: DUF4345 family protein [Thermoanaerobaculia bacterium]|nr:DUF4345 family protein [Thermoanaerobaculia bacterium]
MKLLRILALVAFWSYVVALFVLGAAGVLFPEPELDALYQAQLGGLDETREVLLHQYRFMKGIVIGFGIYCWTFRREIFQPGVHHRIFLATLFLGAGARLLSWGLDARPHERLLSFTVSELIFGLLILAYVQASRRNATQA